jgi:hypothetical protein
MQLPEVNQSDRSLPYSMAIPNIIVSRINPGHLNAVLNLYRCLYHPRPTFRTWNHSVRITERKLPEAVSIRTKVSSS